MVVCHKNCDTSVLTLQDLIDFVVLKKQVDIYEKTILGDFSV